MAGVILTRNEAHHIVACIRALQQFLSCIVVLDSGSTDGTVELARACGAFVLGHSFRDFAHQRQKALDMIAREWILFVDADERVPPALGAEILEVCQAGVQDPNLGGACLPRLNYIVAGQPRWGGFSPDLQLRLLRRRCASYRHSAQVHETAAVTGEVRTLRTALIHYNYDSWHQFHAQQWIYARLAARTTRTDDSRPGWIICKRTAQLFRYRYLHLAGWKDGWLGLRLALWLAWYYGGLPYILALLHTPEGES